MFWLWHLFYFYRHLRKLSSIFLVGRSCRDPIQFMKFIIFWKKITYWMSMFLYFNVLFYICTFNCLIYLRINQQCWQLLVKCMELSLHFCNFFAFCTFPHYVCLWVRYILVFIYYYSYFLLYLLRYPLLTAIYNVCFEKHPPSEMIEVLKRHL